MIIDTTTIVFALLGIVIVALIGWILRLEIMLNRLRAGTSGKRMDEVMDNIKKALAELYTFKGEAHGRLIDAEKKLRSSVRGIETVRFNPFQGTGAGGNQSFASAFINEDGDGVVISSIYSRDRVSVFSKPLTQFDSAYELFDEEKEVVERAKNSLTQN